MNPRRRELLAAGLALAAGQALGTGPALAIDRGVASGRYKDADAELTFSHALALDMDNAEGMLDSDRRLRILLSDREVPLSAICGLAFPPVWSMARAGTLRGLLLEFDPSDRTALHVVVLAPPTPPYSLSTVSISNTEGLWSRLEVGSARVAGELKPEASDRMSFQFSAPVFTDAVEADLKGAAVQTSEPVKVLLARTDAIRCGDWAAARALSTESSAAVFDEMPAELRQEAPRFAVELAQRLRTAKRVVIRRETAAIILDKGEWTSLVRVGGVWKAAD